jgi:hypothetical protein
MPVEPITSIALPDANPNVKPISIRYPLSPVNSGWTSTELQMMSSGGSSTMQVFMPVALAANQQVCEYRTTYYKDNNGNIRRLVEALVCDGACSGGNCQWVVV